jgi:hypothetical protein
MAKGSGGTRGASGGGGSRGTTTVFKGGWSGSAADTSSIVINSIGKQTEKAMQVNVGVNWGSGSTHQKDIWVPKSTIGSITKNKSGSMTLNMKKSMAQSISNNNSFKGYPMEFTFSSNA